MRQLKITKQVTNREAVSLDKYLQEIAREDLITAEEEVQLARKIKQGDKAALDKLTRSNLRFVVSVSKQYQNQGLNLPDLINEGNMGLIKAALRFDETRGFKFISYAVWWIRQSIMQALAEQSRIVRLPLNKIGDLTRFSKCYTELEQQLGREPDVTEIAKHMSIKVTEAKEALKHTGRHISTDAPLLEGEERNFYDLYKSEAEIPDKGLNYESLRIEVKRAVSKLSTREQEVIKGFFGIDCKYPLTLEEIGLKLDLSKERVRQIKENAIKKLRKNSRSKLLKGFLG